MKLPKKIKSSIVKIIKSRPAEDLYVLSGIEKILVKKRGKVFRMPKPGTPVIAFFSGGLDTTVVISILIREFGLKVYPLYIDRKLSSSKKTRQAAKTLARYFKRKYPDNFNEPLIIRQDIPLRPFKKVIYKAENDTWNRGDLRRGVPMQPTLVASTAYFYSLYLEKREGVKIRNIFGAWLYQNSDWYPYEALTSLRSAMLNICNQEGDFSWQFTSLPMEKELGFWWTKSDLVKIGAKHKLPLEDTWTCFSGDRYQCGNCITCGTRMDAFKEAGVKDPTKYDVRFDIKLDRFVKRQLTKINQWFFSHSSNS